MGLKKDFDCENVASDLGLGDGFCRCTYLHHKVSIYVLLMGLKEKI